MGDPIERRLNAAPVGDIIFNVASGIAKAQTELNTSSIQTAEAMSGRMVVRDAEGQPVLDSEGRAQVTDTRVAFGYDVTMGPDGLPRREQRLVSMMELGLNPTFYQFVDTTIEIRLAFSTTETRAESRASKVNEQEKLEGVTTRATETKPARGPERTETLESKETRTMVRGTTVDATYANSYNYAAEASSSVRTKLVPVPPPPMLEARIHALMEEDARLAELVREAWREAVAAHKAAPTQANASRVALVEARASALGVPLV